MPSVALETLSKFVRRDPADVRAIHVEVLDAEIAESDEVQLSDAMAVAACAIGENIGLSGVGLRGLVKVGFPLIERFTDLALNMPEPPPKIFMAAIQVTDNRYGMILLQIDQQGMSAGPVSMATGQPTLVPGMAGYEGPPEPPGLITVGLAIPTIFIHLRQMVQGPILSVPRRGSSGVAKASSILLPDGSPAPPRADLLN